MLASKPENTYLLPNDLKGFKVGQGTTKDTRLKDGQEIEVLAPVS